MAKSNWGITSGFIGKLGNMVGFNWKGKNIQRAHVVSGRKSQSEDQQLARARGVDFGEAALSGNVLTVAICPPTTRLSLAYQRPTNRL